MSVYPFQNGIVLFDVMLLRMFGDSAYIAFQYVNVAFFINAVVSMYVISRYIFREDSSIWTWLVTVTFYPFAMYVVFCYGTMIGFSLAMTAAMFMFIYFDRRRLVYMIPCGIAMTLSLIMKSNYAIVLVGIALYLLFDSVMTKKLKSTIGLVIVLAIYIAGSRSLNIAVEKLTDTPLAQGIPKIAWVAMGMNESVNTPGWFDNYNGYVYEKNNRDQDATVAEAISHIKQRGKAILTTNPLRFYYKKITSQWNNPTWECFDMQERESHTPDYAIKAAVRDGNNTVWKEFMNIVQTLINFGVLIYIAECWKRFDSLTVYELFNAVLMIGGFVFFTFWEAKSQYVAPYYFVIIPYAVIGWKRLISVICQEINNGKTS